MDKLEVKADFRLDDAGTITGIAWPFGSPDAIGDLIERGAFKPSAALPILYEHDGGKAIGTWDSIEETDAGLEAKGRLFLDSVPLAREAHARMKAGRVSGLSIGFRALESKTRADGNRTILSLHLAEISIVANPCHPAARILTVKSAGDAATHEQKEIIVEPELKNTPYAPPGSPEREAYLKALWASPEFKSQMDELLERQRHLKPDPDGAAKTAKQFADVMARMDKLEAKSNRPIGANNNHPAGENDNGRELERKAFISFARRGIDRMQPDEVKALTVSVDANGGYLAPEQFGAELLKKIVEFSPIREYAKVTPISASEIKLPRRLTRASASWVSEIGQRPETGTTFEQATFTPYELSSWVPISLQLLEDNAYNLEGELLEQFAEAIGTAEGAAFVNGDGAGKPKGLLAAAGIAEVKTGNAGTLGADPASTIVGMFHAVQSAIAQNGVWMMNRKTLGSLRQLKDTTGRFLLVDPISAGAATTLLGRPIVEAIDMPDVAANAYPIVFGDFSGYRITDRVGMSVQRDPFSLSDYGQVKFTVRKRVGGDVSHADRFLKLKVAA